MAEVHVGRPGPVPERLPIPDHETRAEAARRRRLDREAFEAWDRMASELCVRCGETRSNVVHDRDPEHSIEGPEYFADMLDELHDFEPSGRWS